jgi:hypothetical protein
MCALLSNPLQPTVRSMKTTPLLLPLIALAAAGCQQKPEAASTTTISGPVAVASSAIAPAAAPAAANLDAEPAHEGCAGRHGDELFQGTEPATTGTTTTVAGAKLANAPLVSVPDLLARPEEHAGKTVRIEGNVSAMCHHMRGWFAVQEDGGAGGTVRVITAPAFLVPEGAIGKRARTEGVVELVEVDAATARHYASEHQVGSAPQTNQPVRSVVVRATGMELF